MRRTIEIAAFCAALLLAALAFHAWLAARDDQIRLAATLSAQKQLLDAADARERDRAATLKETLAQIDALKRTTQTPAQILANLPKYLPLPEPITLAPSSAVSTAAPLPGQGTAPSANLPPPSSAGLPAAPVAQIPAADLKPLYDFVQDCRACQARLAVAQQNAADDAAKIAALTRERDAAVTAAKGGGFWLRLKRNAKWFALGAGVGAAAYAAAHH
jgi:hypothetical protein